MIIRDFRPHDFEGLVDCYQQGFPQGHNRYSLSRLVRFQRDSILVADRDRRVVGVIIGITSHREAWLTGLSVLPGTQSLRQKTSVRLMQALGGRLSELGFNEALASTARRSIKSLTERVGATLVSVETDFYFDGETRHLYRADMPVLNRLTALLSPSAG